MKIKKVGWTTFLLTIDNLSVLTDPGILKESGASFPKTAADVVLFTDYPSTPDDTSILKKLGLEDKVVPDKREKIMEIYTPGEYEVGGIMIRRELNEDFYIIDDRNLRTVYMGATGKDFDPEKVKNLGDVDALILPVGNGDMFMEYDTIEKVISNIDPAILIPCAYKGESKKDEGLKSREEFIQHFGYANARDEGFVNLAKKRVEEDQKSVEVIFLK